MSEASFSLLRRKRIDFHNRITIIEDRDDNDNGGVNWLSVYSIDNDVISLDVTKTHNLDLPRFGPDKVYLDYDKNDEQWKIRGIDHGKYIINIFSQKTIHVRYHDMAMIYYMKVGYDNISMRAFTSMDDLLAYLEFFIGLVIAKDYTYYENEVLFNEIERWCDKHEDLIKLMKYKIKRDLKFHRIKVYLMPRPTIPMTKSVYKN